MYIDVELWHQLALLDEAERRCIKYDTDLVCHFVGYLEGGRLQCVSWLNKTFIVDAGGGLC